MCLRIKHCYIDALISSWFMFFFSYITTFLDAYRILMFILRYCFLYIDIHICSKYINIYSVNGFSRVNSDV